MENNQPKSGRGTLRSYVTGFILSIVLTIAAYVIVQAHISHEIFIPAILILAVAQLFVQLIFFLHLAGEPGPRWKLAAFLSTIGIVLIVIIGSIWIMAHLNYNMMASPSQMNAYIQSQDGF